MVTVIYNFERRGSRTRRDSGYYAFRRRVRKTTEPCNCPEPTREREAWVLKITGGKAD